MGAAQLERSFGNKALRWRAALKDSYTTLKGQVVVVHLTYTGSLPPNEYDIPSIVPSRGLRKFRYIAWKSQARVSVMGVFVQSGILRVGVRLYWE